LVLLAPSAISETRSLQGSWAFRAGDDLAWAQPVFEDDSWEQRSIPDRWPPGGYPESGQMGWYRLYVDVSMAAQSNSQLAISIGGIRNAFELYVDGVLLGRVGRLPPEGRVNFDQIQVLGIPQELLSDERLLIAIRVWGGDELAVQAAGAGPDHANPRLGDPATMMRELLLADLPALLFSAVFAAAGFWFLYFHARVPQLRAYRWFALSALLLAPHLLTLTQFKYSAGLSFPMLEKIESISFLLVLVAVGQFFYAAMNRSVDWWMRLWQVYFIALAFLLLIPGLGIHYAIRPFWQYGAPLITLPFLLVVVHEARIGNPSARVLGVAATAFILTLMFDLLLIQGLRSGPSLIPFGFLSILVGMGVLLVDRFSNLLNRLETEVADRTLELSQVNQRLQQANQTLETRALHDPLTHLLNRRGFEQVVNEEHARIERNGRRYALLLIDIDYFKRVNDAHGHAVGDAVLTAMANVLCTELRDVDRRARWGGEEFVVLLPETDSNGVLAVAEKLRAAVEAMQVAQGAESVQVTVSLGAAVLEAGQSFEDCLARADNALYASKHGGRNQVAIA
jgi:diguanylate cyclase (GGDEF)-like protein